MWSCLIKTTRFPLCTPANRMHTVPGVRVDLKVLLWLRKLWVIGPLRTLQNPSIRTANTGNKGKNLHSGWSVCLGTWCGQNVTFASVFLAADWLFDHAGLDRLLGWGHFLAHELVQGFLVVHPSPGETDDAIAEVVVPRFARLLEGLFGRVEGSECVLFGHL